MLVHAVDESTAAWARAEVRVGPVNRFRAIVVGPDDIPAIADDDEIRAPLAVHDAITQARSDSRRAAETAFGVARILPALPDDAQMLFGT